MIQNANRDMKVLIRDNNVIRTSVRCCLDENMNSELRLRYDEDRFTRIEKIGNLLTDISALEAELRVYEGSASVDIMKDLVKSRYTLISQYSKPRQNWIRAINKVLSRHAVLKSEKFLLDKYGPNYATKWLGEKKLFLNSFV